MVSAVVSGLSSFSLAYALQQAVNAVVSGSFYGLLASSYALVYGITSRINFAFGAITSLGAAITFNVVIAIASATGVSPVTAVVLAGLYAIVACGLFGAVSERIVVRPVVGRTNLAMLVTTISLAIALQEFIRLANGSTDRWLPPLSTLSFVLLPSPDFTLAVGPVQVLGGLAALGGALGLVAFIRRHPFGRMWRACADDPVAAALCGISSDDVRTATFAIASAAAGFAGALMLVLYGNVDFHTGLTIGLKALLAAIVGGIGSVGWALVGGLLLGGLETTWSSLFGAEWRDVAVFGMLVGLFVLRPSGLAPDRGGQA